MHFRLFVYCRYMGLTHYQESVLVAHHHGGEEQCLPGRNLPSGKWAEGGPGRRWAHGNLHHTGKPCHPGMTRDHCSDPCKPCPRRRCQWPTLGQSHQLERHPGTNGIAQICGKNKKTELRLYYPSWPEIVVWATTRLFIVYLKVMENSRPKVW